jgi:hypothetical protein
LRGARTRENQDEYKKLYAMRAGVEGTIWLFRISCG